MPVFALVISLLLTPRIEYGGSYGAGDVIGFLIHLPSPAPPNVPIPPPSPPPLSSPWPSYSDILPVLGVFEPPPKVTLEPNEGSYIEFFKNGKSQGKAYAPIFKGKYYPAVSMVLPRFISRC